MADVVDAPVVDRDAMLKAMEGNPDLAASFMKHVEAEKNKVVRKELVAKLSPFKDAFDNAKTAKETFLAGTPAFKKVEKAKKALQAVTAELDSAMDSKEGKAITEALAAAKATVDKFRADNPELKNVSGTGTRAKGISGKIVRIRPLGADDKAWEEFKNLNQAYLKVNPEASHSIGASQMKATFKKFGYDAEVVEG